MCYHVQTQLNKTKSTILTFFYRTLQNLILRGVERRGKERKERTATEKLLHDCKAIMGGLNYQTIKAKEISPTKEGYT